MKSQTQYIDPLLDNWKTNWETSYLSATTDTPSKFRVAGETPQTNRLFNVTPGLEYELNYTQSENASVNLFIEESDNGTSWQNVVSNASSNGTQTVSFIPSASFLKVSFEASAGFKLQDVSLNGEVLGEDEFGADDGLIHYTSKENWDKYGNSPYANKSELLKQGGISKTINIHKQKNDNENYGNDADAFSGITKENPNLNNELVESFVRKASTVDKAGRAVGVKHPVAKGLGGEVTIIEGAQIIEKATSGDIEGTAKDAAVLTFESVVVDRALASPNAYAKAGAIAYYIVKFFVNYESPDLSGLELPEDWGLLRDQDNTRVGSGQGF